MTERTNISCEMQRAVPSGKDSPCLPAQVANHGAVYDSACPLAEVLYVYSVVFTLETNRYASIFAVLP